MTFVLVSAFVAFVIAGIMPSAEQAERKKQLTIIEKRHRQNQREIKRRKKVLGRHGYLAAIAGEEQRYIAELDQWFG